MKATVNRYPSTDIKDFALSWIWRENPFEKCPMLFWSWLSIHQQHFILVERIPWEGEFIIRSDPWAGLIASCGSFYPMIRARRINLTAHTSSPRCGNRFLDTSGGSWHNAFAGYEECPAQGLIIMPGLFPVAVNHIIPAYRKLQPMMGTAARIYKQLLANHQMKGVGYVLASSTRTEW